MASSDYKVCGYPSLEHTPPGGQVTTADKRKRRKAMNQGKRGQAWVAERLCEVWEGVVSLWTSGRGSKQKDLKDGHTPYTGEVKKWGGAAPWPSTLEDAYQQAAYYAQERHDANIPIVYLLNSPGTGCKQEWRVYMDGFDWLEREKHFANVTKENLLLKAELGVSDGG